MAPLITPLTQSGYSVYTYDSLAHGDSEGDTTNFFEIVESMNAVFDHIGGADFLIGHSMGAAAAVNLRSINGKNVKLVLIAPLYDLQGMIYAHGKASGLHFPLYKKIIGKIEKKFGKTLHEVSPMTIAKNITIPALIFHDEDDMVVPVEQGELFAGELKNSRLVKTSGLGHNRILESKALFDKSLKFFSE